MICLAQSKVHRSRHSINDPPGDSSTILPVIDVCLWLVREAVPATVVVVEVVVEALDDDEEMPGGGADNDDDDTGVGVAFGGVGGEPDSRESGGGSE